MAITLRPAVGADAAALVALRALLFTTLEPAVSPDDSWRHAALRWFENSLGTDDVAAVLAETDKGQVVASALGEVVRRAPSPSLPNGLRGKVSNVVTLPDHRSRGLARRCVTELLDWFATATEVGGVELVAATGAQQLYASLGFLVRDEPTMRLPVSR